MAEQTHCYLFSQKSALDAAVLQVVGDALHTPFRLWQWKSGDDEKATSLWLLALPAPILPHHEARSLRLEEDWAMSLWPEKPDVALAPLGEGAPLSIVLPSTKKLQHGSLTCVRQGPVIFGVLGLRSVEFSRTQAQPAWLLFDIPEELLQPLLTEHLSLDNFELRCGVQEGGRYWVWVRRPELFSVLKYESRSDVQVFQSFAEEMRIFTPWNMRMSQATHWTLASESPLLIVGADGHSRWLDPAGWWLASEVVELATTPKAVMLTSLPEPPLVPIRLRYVSYESDTRPVLWLLRGDEAVSALEELSFTLMPEERNSIALFIGNTESDEETFYVLRDHRGQDEPPLFDSTRHLSFVPFLSEDGLYLQSGVRVYPKLPPARWREVLSLSIGEDVLWQPSIEGQDESLWRIPRHGFGRLDDFVDYRMNAASVALTAFVREHPFTLLFAPEDVQASKHLGNVATTRKKKQGKQANAERKDLPKPSSTLPLQPKAERHRRRSQHVALEQLEERLKEKNRRHERPTPDEWLQLSDLYFEGYLSERRDLWQRESLRSLDQILYLDRSSVEAVRLERRILLYLLELEDNADDAAILEASQEALRDEDTQRMRWGFRLLARLLMNESEGARAETLRLLFYRYLATTEQHLTGLESWIYVVGVAQKLGDKELNERARLRYRQILQDQHRLQREFPAVLLE